MLVGASSPIAFISHKQHIRPETSNANTLHQRFCTRFHISVENSGEKSLHFLSAQPSSSSFHQRFYFPLGIVFILKLIKKKCERQEHIRF